MATVFETAPSIPNQLITERNGVRLYLKREDLLHPDVSGNKFRKLKYNIEQAISEGQDTLLTFGGAFSNHIAATAAAGQLSGFKTIGVIRGEELGADLEETLAKNPTLKFAASCGMKFHFVSRSEYRNKTSEVFLESLKQQFGNFFLVPEGGTNAAAIKGCEEILSEKDVEFDIICSSVGTGGTISGLINSSAPHQKVLGFPALKGDFLKEEIRKYTSKNNWDLITNYHFGGYAKVNGELIAFMNDFRKKHNILLDPVYTGKLLFGICKLMEQGYFSENTRILAIHTGGLQGISGMNNYLKKKSLPQIDV
ncbi:1-aminocyclopropane-1-carboxylate deaminase/D-cysteine desulfhydrase [Salinimicrobium soli]|uniref:1-aminocyclopropane-1-carboxylate deaminase/D-cysteine desulfhydrase n=1 Tax=Salinimicrobium soli TaxID=1254399 RepID=UPI003AAB2F9A